MIKPKATYNSCGVWVVHSPGTFSRAAWQLPVAYKLWLDRNFAHITRV